MAGAGLIEIKRRIKSVQNTRKITKAMGLVATSKLRRARIALKENEDFYNASRDTAKATYNAIKDFADCMYIKGNGSKRKLYIVVASDSGLCGGYNVNIALGLKDHIVSNNEEASSICVGKKGVSYMKRYRMDNIAEFVDIPDKPTIKEVKLIYNHALRLFKENEYGEVNIIYMRFNSPVSQQVEIERLLPISFEGEEDDTQYIIEPKEESDIEATFDFYLQSKLLNVMLNAKTSEQSLRMTAMDGASKNADDLLDALNSKYNRIRQSAITQEIAEIVGGAQAQK